MNFDKLAKRLLNEDPKQWPKSLQDLACDSQGMDLPTKADAAVLSAIAQAKASQEGKGPASTASHAQTGSSAVRYWGAAAAVLLVSLLSIAAVLGWFPSFGGGRAIAQIRLLSGKADLVTGRLEEDGAFLAEKEEMLTPEAVFDSQVALHDQQRLVTHADSSAELAFGDGILARLGENTTLTLGEASLHKSGDTIASKDTDSIHLHLKGELYYQSDRLPADQGFQVATSTAVLRVRGTEYLISAYNNDFTTIRVFQGAVEVQAQATQKRALLQEGQKATVDADGKIRVAQQDLSDRLIRNRYSRKSDVFQKYGTGPIDSGLELQDEASIRKYYGRIFVVTLKDGRQYTGYPSQYKGILQIHTTYGVIEMELADVADLKEVR